MTYIVGKKVRVEANRTTAPKSKKLVDEETIDARVYINVKQIIAQP